MIAIIPVRNGVAPIGAAEAACEAGEAFVVGTGTVDVAHELLAYVPTVRYLEHAFRPHELSAVVAAVISAATKKRSVILPGSPDGRDLAPLLALQLGWPLFAGAIEVRADRVRLARLGGTAIEQVQSDGPFVATLIPGVRGATPIAVLTDTNGTVPRKATPRPKQVKRASSESGARTSSDRPPSVDATSLEVLPPDAATMDLSEASRILGGGAGLNNEQRFRQLASVASLLDASMGATRVITDHGWVGHERQIGTTGVVVDPDLYIAFGISGAVQHTSGLGHPQHIISVNTDEHCPMMQLADLAIVADANATLDELATLLSKLAANDGSAFAAPPGTCPAANDGSKIAAMDGSKDGSQIAADFAAPLATTPGASS